MLMTPINKNPAPRKRGWLSLLLEYASHVITKMEKESTSGKSSVAISKKSPISGEEDLNHSSEYPIRNMGTMIASRLCVFFLRDNEPPLFSPEDALDVRYYETLVVRYHGIKPHNVIPGDVRHDASEFLEVHSLLP